MSAITTNAITSISCPAPYTLVSCGYQTEIVSDKQPRGSWIINQTCYAMNAGSNSDGVYAFARCCESTHSLTCNTYASEFSALQDDSKVNVTCKQSSETLLGCTGHGGAGDLIDGSFPGTYPNNGANANPAPGMYHSYGNTCSAWMSTNDNNGVRSFGTCCKSTQITFDCLAMISNSTVSGQGATMSISCPPQHFMTSCSASSPWHEQNQWYVTNNSECYVRTGGSNVGLRANAICCIVMTVSPTYMPTNNPTFIPTIIPTFIPTIIPTFIPTINPTFIPTINPTFSTVYPTYIPTINPTFIPTTNPIFVPTKYPTTIPTKAPTLYPSETPTKLPTKSPVDSGKIEISTTIFMNTDDELNTNHDRDVFMMQLFIYIIAGFAVIVIVLCIIICYRKKRHKQAVAIAKQIDNSMDRVTSVSTNTININTNTGEEIERNLQLETAVPMTAVTPNSHDEGDTEMISIPPNNSNNNINSANDMENESDSSNSESGGLYNKNVNVATPGNTVTDGHLSNPINDINLMDEDHEYDNNDSDTDGNDKLYMMSGGNVTTKGDS